MKLTPKQKAFVDEYLISGNITEAAEHGQGLIVRQSGKKLIRGTEGQVNRMSNDLISRQALLDDFRNTITEQSDTMDWMNMIARQKAIHLNDGWISVDEKLPEESLNSVIGWDEKRKRCCFVQRWGGRWIFGNDIDSVKITAWRPLPEPYRPERSRN